MAGAPGTAQRLDPSAGLATVRREIQDACRRAGRDPRTVTLVAASKTVPASALEHAIGAGHAAFGENRIQEAKSKWPEIRAKHPEVELHLIGPLQTNKVRTAVELFDAIHSVDRATLCESLARECDRQGRRPTLFVQVNTGAEPQKAGVLPADVDGFLADCRGVYDLPVTGLMCIPPAADPPVPHFALLVEMARRNGLASLSMGMSTDFGQAIMAGATHVRVGSAIFGARA